MFWMSFMACGGFAFVSVFQRCASLEVKVKVIRNKRRRGDSVAKSFEVLERRQMLSVSAFPIVTDVVTSNGLELSVSVSGSQTVTISQSTKGITVTDAGVSKLYAGIFSEILATAVSGNNKITLDSTVTDFAVLQGGSGKDTLVAGAGTTMIYDGSGGDTMVGGTGVDTFVALNGVSNTIWGGKGVDSFWTNSNDKVYNVNSTEKTLNAVHTIAGTFGTQAVAETPGEPAGGSNYVSFSADPLFSSSGPSALDIKQGGLGDCWYLSTLAAIAQTDPNAIRQDIVQLNDGSYLVKFVSGGFTGTGPAVYEHVDGKLPTNGAGGLVYAQLGQGNSTWVAIMEKAFAEFRDGGDSYSNLNGGWMNEAYSDLGIINTNTFYWKSATAMLQQIQTELKSHEAVTAGTFGVPAGTPLIGSHAYTVVAVTTDSHGNLTGLTVRNPWGVVGIAGYAGNNGYVTLTPAQAFGALAGITAGVV